MIYNTSSEFEAKKAAAYFDALVKKGYRIELKKAEEAKSDPQRKYFYAILNIFRLDFGWTLEEAKTYVKRKTGFYYEKNGEKFIKSISDATMEEMSEMIEKFRNLSAEQGCYLPSSEEYLSGSSDIDEYIKRNSYGFN